MVITVIYRYTDVIEQPSLVSLHRPKFRDETTDDQLVH